MAILDPSPANIMVAADAILAGELVCIPTETVYGIAADATNAEAVEKIFSAKNRPADNPLIVHVSDFIQLDDIVAEWTEAADLLANRFWPGPLTLVLRKSEFIPDSVTGGLDTVAIRMPDHAVALELIEACGVPLAAPSANRFMRLSPTRAEMVAPEIAERVACILDGGPCRVGLESTVVDVTSNNVKILRPGGVSRGEIQAALGRPLGDAPPDGPRRSPGNYDRHYAPRAAVRVVDEVPEAAVGLIFGEPTSSRQIRMPMDPEAFASTLYAAMHLLDSQKVEEILVQSPPDEGPWEAVWDRLRRAGGER
jgi:L-threonylcarbamoyladenylate synthase